MSDKDAQEFSKVEQAKAASRGLRGEIAETLADPQRESFNDDDKQLLKFHGIYEQDDRDQRIDRRKQGLGKAYSFMIRICAPGGAVTANQFLDLDEIAGRYANGTLRLTTRQAFQLHGVLKGDLKRTMGAINDALMTSLAACGDVPRNVMASPAPFADDIHRGVQAMARDLAREFAPRTGAYHEIWIDGERVVSTDQSASEEPFFGARYLPRKFKIGVAIDFDNSIDVYAYDAGLIAVTRDGRIEGWNVVAGGGMGMTHNKPDTIARLASELGFVEPDQGVDAIRSLIEIHRDHGDRSNRRHARLKYLLHDWGVDDFMKVYRERLPFPLHEARPTPPPRQLDHLGVHEQGDGRWFLGVWIENGRIKDAESGPRVRSAFRAIAREIGCDMRLTPMQSMLFVDLDASRLDHIRSILSEHGVPMVEDLTRARRYAMACPALPTCGLALADSERVAPEVVGEIEAELRAQDLEEVDLTVRMTGCPNGCARPYNADIGLVGRRPGVYHVYVGGGLAGDRMADLFAPDVPLDALRETLRPLLLRYRADRRDGEGLSDYYQRVRANGSNGERRTVLTGKEQGTAATLGLVGTGDRGGPPS